MGRELNNKIRSIVGNDNLSVDEPMKNHTTFKIGGPADYYICPHSTDELTQLLHLCNREEVPYYIIGNGSNLLVGDKGYRGAIIQIYKNMNHVEVKETRIIAEAGTLLSTVASKALEAGLGGLEFASGIPGTIGGAATMNAGAYGKEMKDVLQEVTIATNQGEIKTYTKRDLELGYRTSMIAKNNYIVLEAVLELYKCNPQIIKETMKDLKNKRVSKQPLEYGSAGSTFKRPEGYFAGKLIMDSGLAGKSIGDAQVSDKHCGFVINRGSATACEVRELMQFVIETVHDRFGVTLEPEIKMLGEF